MDLFSSVEAGNAAIGLTGKGTEKFSSALAEMANASGATETAFETMEETTSRRLEKLYARASVLLLDLGGAVAPIAEKILDAIESVGDWFDANGEAVFLPLTNALSNLMIAFDKIGAWWQSGGGESVFTAIGNAASWLSETFQPFIDMYNKFWGEQAAKMTDFWETDGATVMQALENIRAAFQFLIEQLAALWAWIWPYMEGILGPAVDILLDIVGVFAALFAGDWDKLGERLVDLTLSIMDLIYGVFSLGFDLIVGGFVAFANIVSEIMAGLANAIIGAIEGALNIAIDAINDYIKKANEILGTNFALIEKVSLTRVVATKIEAPKLSDLTGGKTPSELIRDALGIDVSKKEAIAPEETAPTESTTMPQTTTESIASAQTTTAPPSTATPPAAAPAVLAPTEPTTEPTATTTTTTVDLSEITAELATLSPAPVVDAIGELKTALSPTSIVGAITDLKNALVGMLSETETIDGKTQTTSIAALIAQAGAALGINVSEEEEIALDMPVSRAGEEAIAGGDIYITTQIDGYKVGEAIFRNYNRRTGGGLNG